MHINFEISTDKTLLNIDFIHDFISNSYWGKGRVKAQTKKTIEKSCCFGMYAENKEQIGFGRIVTDYTFFGYFMDVFIHQDYQGMGLGKILIEHMLNHEITKGLQTVALKTKDAQTLYAKYGFKKIGNSSMWMSIDRQKLD